MSVQMIRYEAGFTNPWHRHNCAHGIYVLDGTPSGPTRGRSARAASSGSPKGCSWSTAPPTTPRDDPVHHQQALRHPLRLRGRAGQPHPLTARGTRVPPSFVRPAPRFLGGVREPAAGSMWLGSSAASVVNSEEGHAATAAIRPAARGPRRPSGRCSRGPGASGSRSRCLPWRPARRGDRVGQGHAQTGRRPGRCGRAGGPDPAQGGARHAFDDRAQGSGRACGRSGPPTGPGPLPAGSRVHDAIAGGVTAGADLDAVNLARRLTDGEQVRIPGPGDPAHPPPARRDRVTIHPHSTSTPPPSSSSTPSPASARSPPATSSPTARPTFTTVDQLLEVPGIGQRRFDQLKDLVTVA